MGCAKSIVNPGCSINRYGLGGFVTLADGKTILHWGYKSPFPSSGKARLQSCPGGADHPFSGHVKRGRSDFVIGNLRVGLCHGYFFGTCRKL